MKKVWVIFVGTVMFLLTKDVMTPPAVSKPSERGVTSRRSRLESSSDLSLPESMAACTVALYATASFGLIVLQGYPLINLIADLQ